MGPSLKKRIGVGCGTCAFVIIAIIIVAAVSGSKQASKIEGTSVKSTPTQVEQSPEPSPSPSIIQSPSPTPTPTKTSTKTPTPAPTETEKTPTPKPPPVSNCDPNYSGACVPIASDVDCAGGTGNGPAYVHGPVYVIGSDIYDLDRDGDGVGCE